MVADTIHLASQGGQHPTFHLFGHDVVADIPLPTLLLAVFGGLVALRYVYSWLRLLAELTIIPGMSVGAVRSPNRSSKSSRAAGGRGLS